MERLGSYLREFSSSNNRGLTFDMQNESSDSIARACLYENATTEEMYCENAGGFVTLGNADIVAVQTLRVQDVQEHAGLPEKIKSPESILSFVVAPETGLEPVT